MIRALDDLPGGVLGFEASGTLTACDDTDERLDAGRPVDVRVGRAR
jgi:hypothetical protein